MKKSNLILTTLLLLGFSAGLFAQTPVERHGQLHVDGNKLKDQCGRVVEFKTMSFFHHVYTDTDKYLNEDCIRWLRDDWKLQMIRVPIVADRGGNNNYFNNPEFTLEVLYRAIDAAIATGIYVVVDWHQKKIWKDEADAFFDLVAAKYKNTPNVVWEIWNEPNSGIFKVYQDYKWQTDVKPYCEQVIATIRKHSNNVIVAPSPFFSSQIHEPALDPVRKDASGNPVFNIAYAMHFYSGTHKEAPRKRMQYAYDLGLCIMVTECGSVNADGAGTDDWNEWDKWVELMDDLDISWMNWSLSYKSETASKIKQSASFTGGWSESDLTAAGVRMRNWFRANNSLASSCGSPVTLNSISIANCPSSVGTNALKTLNVNFSPSNASNKSLSWSSSNESVATVDINGTVYGVSPGNVTITARSWNGKTAQCSFNIADDAGGDWVPVIADDFESGFGNWVDGGANAQRVSNATYAGSGTYSVELINGTAESNITSIPLNLSAASKYKLRFTVYAKDMDQLEQFAFQSIIDGETTTIEAYTLGGGFMNEIQKTILLDVEGPFNKPPELRFANLANGNQDFVYLDDIVVLVEEGNQQPNSKLLSVINGTGDGYYQEGERVNIAADSPPNLKVFDKWTGDVAYVANVNSANTTVTMPADNVTVTATFKYEVPPGGSGTITYKRFDNINGTAVSALTNSSKFPDNPDATQALTSFASDHDIAENFGAQIIGYLHPSKTGNYNFWISSDDNSELWLSTNDQTGSRVKIASVPGYTAKDEWDKYTEQASAAISLTGGQRYYIEALHKEATRGDHVAVRWSGPGFTATIIDGPFLSPFDGSVIPTYTLTVNNGSGDGEYAQNASIPISADAPPSGQRFKEWIGDVQYVANAQASSTTVTMPARDIAVTATYEDNPVDTYTLTVNNGTGGGQYEEGEVVDISATIPSGQNFVAWTGDVQYVEDVSDPSSQVTMPAGNVEVTATFDGGTVEYTLTVNNGTGGGQYEEGEVVDITATIPSGQTFVAWTGDVQYVEDVTDPSSQVTMPAGNVEVTATFDGGTVEYTLTVNNGTGGGQYEEGEVVDIAATIPSGQNFVAWTGDVQYVEDVNDASSQVTMPASNVEVTATFESDGTGTQGTIVLRARGFCNGENLELRINDVAVASFTMTKRYTNYTYNGIVSGNIKVAFTNDNSSGCNSRLFLDFIRVDGTRYQTERTATRVGKGSGQRLDENGHFDFGTLKSAKEMESLSKESIALYPNPANNVVHFKANGTYTITLINTSGQTVKQALLTNDSSLDISDLSNGLYIVKIRINNSIQTRKLFKK